MLRTDGTADVGTWNGEVRMGPQVASVRQNLQMLVDGGRVNPTCATGGTKEWGAYFHDHPVGAPTGFALFPAEQVPPLHYLSPSSRDWFSWELR